jgi:hypothetical protein
MWMAFSLRLEARKTEGSSLGPGKWQRVRPAKIALLSSISVLDRLYRRHGRDHSLSYLRSYTPTAVSVRCKAGDAALAAEILASAAGN